jgi:hypothetical protein
LVDTIPDYRARLRDDNPGDAGNAPARVLWRGEEESMAKKTMKGGAKRGKKASSGTRAKAAPRKPGTKRTSAKKAGPVTAAVTTVMDRLRAWSPSRYSTR